MAKLDNQVSKIPHPESGHFKVAVLVPSGGYWHTAFGLSLTNMMMETRTVPFKGADKQAAFVISVQSSLLPFSREKLVREALHEGCSHILWLDSDMEFPKMMLHRLIEHDAPFVAANYVTKSIPVRTTATLASGKNLATTKDSTGLVEVDSVGFGAALIKTEYVRCMRPPLFMVDWFGETGSYRGEDVYFCHKFRRMSQQKIYVDQDLSKQVRHMGLYPYSLPLLDKWEEGYLNDELMSPLNPDEEEQDNAD